MKNRNVVRLVAAITCAVVGVAGIGEAQAQSTGTAAKAVTILQMPGQIGWRYFETWQTDVARIGEPDKGEKLVRVEPRYWFCERKPAVVTTDKITGSPFPPDDWRNAEFNDSGWLRIYGGDVGRTEYRSKAMLALRGRFEVKDPARVSELSLFLGFQGGAAVYLNGKELKRSALPAGKLTNDMLADDYPKETDMGANPAELINANDGATWRERVNGKDGASWRKEKGHPVNFLKRDRVLDVKIPPAELRTGINTLAVEIHRAPGHDFMFTDPIGFIGSICAWDRCEVHEIRLSAVCETNAIVPNIAQPDKVIVWNATTMEKPVPSFCGDPNEPIQPITLTGLRNGTFSGQFMVSAARTMQTVKVTAAELKNQSGGQISAANVEIGYTEWVMTAARPEPSILDVEAITNAVQPVWVSIAVPRDAAGEYQGTLAVTVDGARVADVPVRLKVASDWVLPAPKDFKTFIDMLELPDAVAARYGVPMWSEEHWRLLDKVFEQMAKVGVKDIHVTLVGKTNLGNEQSMMRWVRQSDGTWKHDFSIIERYLDLATKHLGKVPAVVVWVEDHAFRGQGAVRWQAGKWRKENHPDDVVCTEFDPKTGQTKEFFGPAKGSAESATFWKPALDGMRAVLARRGMEKTMFLAGCTMGTGMSERFKTMAPDVRWYNRLHHGQGYPPEIGFNQVSCQTADPAVWNPDIKDPFFQWRFPKPRIANNDCLGMIFSWAPNSGVRTVAECIQFCNAPQYDPVCGLGNLSADNWPVFKDRDNNMRSYVGLYTHGNGLDHSASPLFVGMGQKFPVASVPLRLLQESLQDAEVRMFIVDAMLDHKDALGPDLLKRCHAVNEERQSYLKYFMRANLFASYNNNNAFNTAFFDKNTAELYVLAGAVAQALKP